MYDADTPVVSADGGRVSVVQESDNAVHRAFAVPWRAVNPDATADNAVRPSSNAGSATDDVGVAIDKADGDWDMRGLPMAKLTPKKAYGALLTRAIRMARLDPYEIAKPCQVVTRTVARWQAGETQPNPFQQRNIVHLLHETGRVPRAMLEELALASADDLVSLGLESPPPKRPAAPLNAQKVIDDAVREAAEELSLEPKVLRRVASRLYQAIAEGNVPADAAARLAVAGRAERNKGPTGAP